MKHLLSNSWPLLDKNISGTPNGITKWLRKMWATWINDIFSVRLARVSLLYRSVIITTNWLLDLVLGIQTGISVAINSTAPLFLSSFNWPWCLSLVAVRRQSLQFWIVFYTSAEMFGQYYLFRSVSCIRRSSGWPAMVEWCAKCRNMGRVDCGRSFCTVLSMRNNLTNSSFFSKMNENPGTPTAGTTLLHYASLPCELMNSSRVERSGFVSIWVFFHFYQWFYWVCSVCVCGNGHDWKVFVYARIIGPFWRVVVITR